MKKILIIILVTICTSAAFSQSKYENRRAPARETETTNGFKKENLFLGGNFGLGIGSYTNINISPQMGYHLTPMFDVGAGINFQYISQKTNDNFGNDYAKISQLITGLNVFGRFFPFRQGFIQAQPEFNYVSIKETYYNSGSPANKYSINVPSVLIGAGANIDGLLIGVFYDAMQNRHSPYGNQPFINFGYVLSIGGR